MSDSDKKETPKGLIGLPDVPEYVAPPQKKQVSKPKVILTEGPLSYNPGTRSLTAGDGMITIPTVVAGGDSGLMTGSDKRKLDSVEFGATANQQAGEVEVVSVMFSGLLSPEDTNVQAALHTLDQLDVPKGGVSKDSDNLLALGSDGLPKFALSGDGLLGADLSPINPDSLKIINVSGPPVNDSTVAYYAGQIVWDTKNKKFYEVIRKSEDPETGGRGSVFKIIEDGEHAPKHEFYTNSTGGKNSVGTNSSNAWIFGNSGGEQSSVRAKSDGTIEIQSSRGSYKILTDVPFGEGDILVRDPVSGELKKLPTTSDSNESEFNGGLRIIEDSGSIDNYFEISNSNPQVFNSLLIPSSLSDDRTWLLPDQSGSLMVSSDRVFMDASNFEPNNPPTSSVHTIAYYTGTNDPDDIPTHIWYIDGNNNATVLKAPVTDEVSQHGKCLDIADTRIQRGKVSPDKLHYVVELPDEFGDDDYEITMTAFTSNQMCVARIHPKSLTTMSFAFDSRNIKTHDFEETQWSWIAIGKKP